MSSIKTFLTGLFGGGASKFWVAVVGSVAAVTSTGHVDWKTLTVAVLTPVIVYLAPNKTPQ
jgi:hypothetical protein